MGRSERRRSLGILMWTLTSLAIPAGVLFGQGYGDYARSPASAGPVPIATAGSMRGTAPAAYGATRDRSVRRVQEEIPQVPAAGTPVPGAAEMVGRDPADLSVPAADRPIGGGEPTAETVATEEAAEDEGPTLLQDVLGLGDSPIKVYGWIQNSYTGNTNGKPPSGTNFGVTPNYKANSWMGNQYYLIFEKPIEQNDEINFGFRLDNLFGNDWQFNFMQGLFNDAFGLGDFAGYDMAQLYGEVHLPVLTEGGLDIKGGRFYTIAGYEQVPAIARPLLSVPYMFTFGQPFTHTGVLTTLHVNDRFNLYNGAINGWDRWVNERYQWGYIGGFSLTSEDDKTTLAVTAVWGPNQYPSFLPANQQLYTTGYINIPTLAGIDNPGYHRNDRTLFTTVLTHIWDEKLTQVIETDQGWERSVPGLASNGRNGAGKSEQWQSFGNWFMYQITPQLTGVWRSEVFWDQQGGRVNFAKRVGRVDQLAGDRYYEMTLGLIYKPCPNIWIRPEARYDWAQFHTPYNDGTRGSQLTLGFDVIVLF